MVEKILLSDQEQREQALNPSESFIVQAPAGSGKTGLLIQRFLLLLSRVKTPEQVLAITFTRKAAGEMRERVLAALKSASESLNRCSEINYQQTTLELAQQVLAQDKKEGWHLLENPNRLRIQTIDGLCNSLTQQLPILSRFGAQAQIKEDCSFYYQQAAKALLESWENNTLLGNELEHILLNHIDNKYTQAIDLFSDMLSHRDQWLVHVLRLSLDNPQDFRQTMEDGLRTLNEEAFLQCKQSFPREFETELLTLLRYSASHLLRFEPNNKMLMEVTQLSQLPNPRSEDLQHEAKTFWLALADLLLTKEGEVRKTHNKNNGFPSSSEAKNKEEKELYNHMKLHIKDICQQIEKNHNFLSSLRKIKQLPPMHYTDYQWESILGLLKLLHLAAAHLLVVFQEQGITDFTEISQRALDALGQAEAPSDLALHLDYKIQHLLIDEFQDTSLTQFRLIERLLAGWQPGDDRTVFLVGDPMQSIYRFRQAEVGLFLQVRQQGIANLQLRSLVLNTNFRSTDPLVYWFNQTFGLAFPEKEDINLGAITFSASHAATSEASPIRAVQVHPLENYDAVIEAECVIDIVQDWQKKPSGETMAILVRSRSHLQEISAKLQEHNIDYTATEIDKLSNKPLINDLLALTSALLHPADRIAWLAILRAPWCGFSLADLHTIADQTTGATIWENLKNYPQLNLSPEGKQVLARVLPLLQQAMSLRGDKPWAQLIEETWLALGGPACIESLKELEVVDTFLNLITEMEEGADILDLAQLKIRLNKLHANTLTTQNSTLLNQLHIMTIHKAKGLEFDHVILPGLARTTRGDDNKMLLWLERQQLHSPNKIDLIMAPIKASASEGDSIYQYLKQVEKEKNELEMTRLLYVAATRAKCSLHMIIPTEKPLRGSLLSLIWPAMAKYLSPPASSALSLSHSSPTKPDAPLLRLTPEWQNPLMVKMTMAQMATPQTNLSKTMAISPNTAFSRSTTSGAYPVEPSTRLAKQVGILIHQALQHMSLCNLQDWNAEKIKAFIPYWETQLNSAGIETSAQPAALDKIASTLENVLADEQARWLLDFRHQDAHSEYPITIRLADEKVTCVIDRTFIDEQGTRWIIDYKTTSFDPAFLSLETFLQQEQNRHQAQLQQYAQAFTWLEQPKSIMLGLYFPLHQAWYSWPYCIN